MAGPEARREVEEGTRLRERRRIAGERRRDEGDEKKGDWKG
jgi:hypothetical protein